MTEKQRRLRKQASSHLDEQRTEFAREQHRAFRRDYELKEKRRRALMSLGRRVDTALVRARALSDVSSASLDRTHHGKPSSSPPAPINGLLYGHAEGSVVDIYERRIRILTEGLEHELDAHKIRPLVAELSGEITEEIEARLIRDFEGEPPNVVAFLDPAWSGMRNAVRAIKATRIRHHRHPITGMELE